ncbi:hypothetical protein GCM10027361_41950 [Erwinia aphidicola]
MGDFDRVYHVVHQIDSLVIMTRDMAEGPPNFSNNLAKIAPIRWRFKPPDGASELTH